MQEATANTVVEPTEISMADLTDSVEVEISTDEVFIRPNYVYKST